MVVGERVGETGEREEGTVGFGEDEKGERWDDVLHV